MTPRRLIPYVVIFLIVVGTYVGLRWQQGQKETREQAAKQVFKYQEGEITALTLKHGQEEVQLNRQGPVWELTKPVKAKADAETVGFLVRTLADLKKERDLGPGDFKTFGLGENALTVSFTAKGEQHRVVVGEAVPGGRGHYARKDEDPDILMISSGAREALNQTASKLRDKTLWAFDPAQVKAIKLRTDKTAADLEKIDSGTWRWSGKADFKVRGERVEDLLRQLKQARIAEFPAAEPKDLRAAGLAPQAKTAVTLVTPQGSETLFLGTGIGSEVYARLGERGQVVKVGKDLPDQIVRALSTLEDRRLWTGSVAEVGKVTWGPPGRTWTAVKEQDHWKLSGPDQAASEQSGPRFQMGLTSFQNLEYASLLPPASAEGPEAYLVELMGPDGKPLFRLAEVAKKGEAVMVRTKAGETAGAALIAQKDFTRWQQEMERLSNPPASPAK